MNDLMIDEVQNSRVDTGLQNKFGHLWNLVGNTPMLEII